MFSVRLWMNGSLVWQCISFSDYADIIQQSCDIYLLLLLLLSRRIGGEDQHVANVDSRLFTRISSGCGLEVGAQASMSRRMCTSMWPNLVPDFLPPSRHRHNKMITKSLTNVAFKLCFIGSKYAYLVLERLKQRETQTMEGFLSAWSGPGDKLLLLGPRVSFSSCSIVPVSLYLDIVQDFEGLPPHAIAFRIDRDERWCYSTRTR